MLKKINVKLYVCSIIYMPNIQNTLDKKTWEDRIILLQNIYLYPYFNSGVIDSIIILQSKHQQRVFQFKSSLKNHLKNLVR